MLRPRGAPRNATAPAIGFVETGIEVARVSNVWWEPDQSKPRDASALEDEIQRAAPGAQVKLTLRDGQWLVRALLPAAMCGRGGGLASRDVSAVVADLLADHDLPARVFSRQ